MLQEEVALGSGGSSKHLLTWVCKMLLVISVQSNNHLKQTLLANGTKLMVARQHSMIMLR